MSKADEDDAVVSVEPDASTTEATGPGAPREAEPAEGNAVPKWRRWLPRPGTAVLIVLLVAATAGCVVFGSKFRTLHNREDAGRAASAAAQDYAVALTNIDFAHLDADTATVLNGATGEFEAMYRQSAEQLKPVLLQAKAVSKGRVVAASVQSESENHAVIMLFVDAEITNVTNPQPRLDRNRLLMTMDRVDGRWLASKVELP
ncbi:hypothetical protein [Nocardia cerradoensis]|uniref:hypothetical protein n=1 Tax=Nocardia cerradoensis TaxID=85688 RepID=UPI0005850FF2|nr:hypothetical protein [Nocardia cerradoensis]NKY42521.1 hypothetical protein [Nocardia cerradoensis]